MILAQVEIDAHFGQHRTKHESGSWGAASFVPPEPRVRTPRGPSVAKLLVASRAGLARIRQLIMQSAWE
jgi:hypothetical protein